MYDSGQPKFRWLFWACFFDLVNPVEGEVEEAPADVGELGGSWGCLNIVVFFCYIGAGRPQPTLILVNVDLHPNPSPPKKPRPGPLDPRARALWYRVGGVQVNIYWGQWQVGQFKNMYMLA